jgi:hypothetical protein
MGVRMWKPCQTGGGILSCGVWLQWGVSWIVMFLWWMYVVQEVNEEWIGDKTRFSYNGLKRQQLSFVILMGNCRSCFGRMFWSPSPKTLTKKARSKLGSLGLLSGFRRRCLRIAEWLFRLQSVAPFCHVGFNWHECVMAWRVVFSGIGEDLSWASDCTAGTTLLPNISRANLYLSIG